MSNLRRSTIINSCSSLEEEKVDVDPPNINPVENGAIMDVPLAFDFSIVNLIEVSLICGSLKHNTVVVDQFVGTLLLNGLMDTKLTEGKWFLFTHPMIINFVPSPSAIVIEHEFMIHLINI